MNGIEVISENGVTYAIIIRRGFTSEKKYNFLTPAEYPMQLGANYYQAGETIRRHHHPDKNLAIKNVQEFIIMNRGRVRAFFYDENREICRDTVLEQGDMILLTAGGHGFEVLEETTLVEIKQGPYDGESDKVLF